LKGADKKYLVAYYIYFRHRTKRQSYNAGVGIEVEAATDNSKPSSLYVKLIEIWNEFIAMYGDYSGDFVIPPSPAVVGPYNYPPHTYPADYNDPASYNVEIVPMNYYWPNGFPYVNCNEYPASAFNYLLSKQADFPNWSYKSQGGEINRFGL